MPSDQAHLLAPVRAAHGTLQAEVQNVLCAAEPVSTASQAVLVLEGVMHVGRVGTMWQWRVHAGRASPSGLMCVAACTGFLMNLRL